MKTHANRHSSGLNFIRRQNGSVTVYSSEGFLYRVEDCPCPDGRKHFVYAQGHMTGSSILDYKCTAAAQVSGKMVQGVLHSTLKGWEFRYK